MSSSLEEEDDDEDVIEEEEDDAIEQFLEIIDESIWDDEVKMRNVTYGQLLQIVLLKGIELMC